MGLGLQPFGHSNEMAGITSRGNSFGMPRLSECQPHYPVCDRVDLVSVRAVSVKLVPFSGAGAHQRHARKIPNRLRPRMQLTQSLMQPLLSSRYPVSRRGRRGREWELLKTNLTCLLVLINSLQDTQQIRRPLGFFQGTHQKICAALYCWHHQDQAQPGQPAHPGKVVRKCG